MAFGQNAFDIERPFVLDSKGRASGHQIVVNTYTTDPDCADLEDPTCPRESQRLSVHIKCMEISGNNVWWSGEITGYGPDPRMSFDDNSIAYKQAQQHRLIYWGRYTDNGGTKRDVRALNQRGVGTLIEGIDNPVSETGVLNSVTLGLDGRTAKTMCELRDDSINTNQADFVLLCTAANDCDCDMPYIDFLSPNGYNTQQFHKFVSNTAIQWIDQDGNAFGQAVPNTVYNLLNPPEEVVYLYESGKRYFDSGDIKLIKKEHL